MTDERAIQAFLAVYIAALGLSTIATLAGAIGALGGVAAPLVAILAGVELLSLALFAFGGSRTIGCAGLVAVFAVAAVHEVESGGAPFRFAIYAAAAVLIAVLTRRRGPAS